ncbi:MAG: hypothetical protein M1817_000227 [Caeruleum heppii]|nr:MAG: hypothetical protein M1817_000227 [Caeruleum heppii]
MDNLSAGEKVHLEILRRKYLQLLPIDITKIPSDVLEVSEDLITRLSHLIALPSVSEAIAAQRKSYVTYTLSSSLSEPKPEEIVLMESRALISSSGSTGLRTWEAALHLGTYLLTDQGNALVKGKHVLELGAGTGFLSILCAKYLQTASVRATDGDEAVVDDLRHNIAMNELPDEAKIQSGVLRWGRTSVDQLDESLGVVLGADITYDTSIIPSLVATLVELFDGSPELVVIFSATIRNETTFETFLSACSAFLHWTEVVIEAR